MEGRDTKTREPAILYTVISRDGTPLAENAIATGTFVGAAHQVLEEIHKHDAMEQKMSYKYAEFYFHFMKSEHMKGLVALCFCDEGFPGRIAFVFLDHILDAFLRKFSRTTIEHAAAFGLSQEFEARLRSDMLTFSYDKAAVDKMVAVKQKVAELTDVMIKNIKLANERGNALQIVVGQAQQLAKVTKQFDEGAARVRNKFWWDNVKLWIITVLFILFLVWLVLSLACGFTFSACRPSSTPT